MDGWINQFQMIHSVKSEIDFCHLAMSYIDTVASSSDSVCYRSAWSPSFALCVDISTTEDDTE